MTMPDRYKHNVNGYYTNESPVQCDEPGYEYRWICQGCREEGHKQGEPDEVHDCKMVFVKEGKTQGQCCCYSKEHGIRSE